MARLGSVVGCDWYDSGTINRHPDDLASNPASAQGPVSIKLSTTVDYKRFAHLCEPAHSYFAFQRGSPDFTALFGTARLRFVFVDNQPRFDARFSLVLNRIVLPAFSRLQSDPDNVGRVSVATTRRIGILAGTLVPFAGLVAPLIIPVIGRAERIGAIPLFYWLLADFVPVTCVGILVQTQYSIGRSTDRTKAVVLIGLLRAVVTYLIVRVAGGDITDVGAGLFFINFFDMCLMAWLLRTRVTGFQGIGREVLVPVTVLALANAIAVYGAKMLVAVPQTSFLRVAVGVLIYVVLLMAYNFVDPRRPIVTELAAVLRMMRRPSA